MFAINVPLRDKDDVDRLVEAGADSFYCGLNDVAGTSGGGGINQRQSDRSSFSSVSDFERAVRRVHDQGREVFLAVNTRLLTDSYMDRFTRQIDIASDLGVDAVIIGSINGILFARERHPEMKIAASVGLGVLNSRSARWAAGLGAYRVIVSRHLTPDEIAMTCDNAPDVEIEAFLMNGKCGNFDAMCGYDYYDPSGPMANFTGCVFVADRRVTRYRRWACGACALPSFATRPNFAAAKIIGRDFDVESVEKAARLTFRLRPLLYSPDCPTAEFRTAARRAYLEEYGRDCAKNCHYPIGDDDDRSLTREDQGGHACTGCGGCR